MVDWISRGLRSFGWRRRGRPRVSRPAPVLDPPDMELVARIDAAIETLPELAREVFILHRFEDLNYARIARRLGITPREVERQIAVALIHLVEAIDESKAQAGHEHHRCGRA